MKYPLNRELLVEQMTALGLSERQVLERTTVPNAALRIARMEGHLQGHTSVRQLVELADALCVSASELLACDPAAQSNPRQNPDADCRTVLSLLFGARRLVDTGRLARAMGWDRSRLLEALDHVPAALELTGLRLVTSGASVAVQPEQHPDKATRQALATAQGGHNGLTVAQANVLRRIIDGDHVENRRTRNTEKLIIGALRNLGCIEPDERGRYQASAALRLALDMK